MHDVVTIYYLSQHGTFQTEAETCDIGREAFLVNMWEPGMIRVRITGSEFVGDAVYGSTVPVYRDKNGAPFVFDRDAQKGALMNTYNGEQVLVVGSNELKGILDEDSLDKARGRILSAATASFRDRDEVELTPRYKQVIPYCLLIWYDQSHDDPFCAQGEPYVYMYNRGGSGGEQRLANKYSIGVGGHINPCDQRRGWDNMLYSCAMREISEEIGLEAQDFVSSSDDLGCLGMVYDETTPVGQVHLGIIDTYYPRDHVVEEREDGIFLRTSGEIRGRFVPVQSLVDQSEIEFESWSRIALQMLFEAYGL